MLIMRLVTILLTATLLGGCFHDHVLPQTSALAAVHDTYQQEFSAYAGVPADPSSAEARNVTAKVAAARSAGQDDDQVAAAAGGATAGLDATRAEDRASGPPPSPFVETLSEIRAFRTQFAAQQGELKQAFAHLVVLEGMVYLQSFEFGNAAAISDDVEKAGGVLTSKTGLQPRDQLLAKAYPHLLVGWRQIHRDLYLDKMAKRDDLKDSAAGVRNVLKTVPADNSDPHVDSAGGYLALSAGMFWTWLHELNLRDCNDKDRTCDTEIYENLDTGAYYCSAAQGLYPFLADTERKAVDKLVASLSDLMRLRAESEQLGLQVAQAQRQSPNNDAENLLSQQQAVNERIGSVQLATERPLSAASGRLVLIRWQAWFVGQYQGRGNATCKMPESPAPTA